MASFSRTLHMHSYIELYLGHISTAGSWKLSVFASEQNKRTEQDSLRMYRLNETWNLGKWCWTLHDQTTNTVRIVIHRSIRNTAVVITQCKYMLLPVPVGPRPLACWDCGFEFRRGHWCLSVVECCVLLGRGLCDGPIPLPEESYRVCVSLSVIRCNINLYIYSEQVEKDQTKKERKDHVIPK